MRAHLLRLFRDESGQDMVEYTLLIAFVVLTSAALLMLDMDVVQAIWTSTADQLNYAADHHL